jgi:hypothetical protein
MQPRVFCSSFGPSRPRPEGTINCLHFATPANMAALATLLSPSWPTSHHNLMSVSRSPLSSPPDSPPRTKRRKVSAKKSAGVTDSADVVASPTDAFQQVTVQPFADQYRVQDMGYGGDVYYQSDVSRCKALIRAVLTN